MKHLFYLVIIICFTTNTFSQEEFDKELVRKYFEDAEEFFAKGEYNDALYEYNKIFRRIPNDANIRYKIGMCYLNIPGSRDKAEAHLAVAAESVTEKYKKNDLMESKAPIVTYAYLGQAYMLNYKFKLAAKAFNKFISSISPDNKEYIDLIKYQIQCCQFAEKQMQNPNNIFFENIGERINDNYSNFNYITDGNGEKEIYSSKLKFYDAVMFNRPLDPKNNKPENIIPQISIDELVYPTGLSYDGDTLLLVLKKIPENFEIFYSVFGKNKWGEAKNMGSIINSTGNETHASFSPDGKTIYFVSNRPGGYGGTDIYSITRNEKGKWSEPVNLGSNINTKYDEATPFLTPEGTRLYFSSNGHVGMGGFDVFYSQLQPDNTWEQPQNVGYPLNTPDNETFYFPTSSNTGYISAYGKNSFGNLDIFEVTIK